jgi:FtsX-like permease family protein
VSDLYEDVFKEPRFFVTLMSFSAGLALLTASVGLYGLVNYAVAQRTREIGVRIALGANLHRIIRLVLWDALIPVAFGVAWRYGRVLVAFAFPLVAAVRGHSSRSKHVRARDDVLNCRGDRRGIHTGACRYANRSDCHPPSGIGQPCRWRARERCPLHSCARETDAYAAPELTVAG